MSTKYGHYSSDITNDWRVHIEKVNEKGAVLSVIERVLYKLSQIEILYSSALNQILQSLKNPPNLSSDLCTVLEVLTSSIALRIQQTDSLSENIREEVIHVTLTPTLKNHEKVLEQITSDIQTLDDNLKAAEEKVAESEEHLTKLGEKFLETADSKNHVAYLGTPNAVNKSAKMLGLADAIENTEKDYADSLKKLAQARTNYNEYMPDVMKSLQKLETKQNRCLKDCLKKLFVYQMSYMRTSEYNINQVVKKLDAANVLESFFDPSAYTLPTYTEYPKHWSLLSLSNSLAQYGINENTQSSSPRYDNNFYENAIDNLLPSITRIFEEDQNDSTISLFDGFLDMIWKSNKRSTILQQQYQIECKFEENYKNRLMFLDRLAQKVLDNNYCISYKCGFESLAEMLTCLLSFAYLDMDIPVIRAIMILAQKFYFLGRGKKPAFVQKYICEAPGVWNHQKMWMQIILVSLAIEKETSLMNSARTTLQNVLHLKSYNKSYTLSALENILCSNIVSQLGICMLEYGMNVNKCLATIKNTQKNVMQYKSVSADLQNLLLNSSEINEKTSILPFSPPIQISVDYTESLTDDNVIDTSRVPRQSLKSLFVCRTEASAEESDFEESQESQFCYMNKPCDSFKKFSKKANSYKSQNDSYSKGSHSYDAESHVNSKYEKDSEDKCYYSKHNNSRKNTSFNANEEQSNNSDYEKETEEKLKVEECLTIHFKKLQKSLMKFVCRSKKVIKKLKEELPIRSTINRKWAKTRTKFHEWKEKHIE